MARRDLDRRDNRLPRRRDKQGRRSPRLRDNDGGTCHARRCDGALTAFGLEEWADYYATQAYSDYWGGSHLFLADRYTGKFNKNSELFKGYITEPTAFGTVGAA